MAKAREKQPSFEEAIAELESITDRIEAGEIPLAQCLSQYERGMKLIKRCQSLLGAAERRVTELTASSEGEVTESGNGNP